MLKKIRVLLDYGAYPVWLYDENGDLIDTLLPLELRSDRNLDNRFDDLQQRYEALFINNTHEFTYIGFKSTEECQSYVNDWRAAVAELRAKVAPGVIVQDELREDELK
ncbi:MAG: hypothetical protein IJH38_04955 [Clostridia bacterium]|nr:hypothetical protein [Clostridia bacterium]